MVLSRENRSDRISCSTSISPTASRAPPSRSPARPFSRSAPGRAASPARCWRSARPASSRSSATSARSRRSQEIAAHYPGRLEIVAADALTFDPRTQLERRAGAHRRQSAVQYRHGAFDRMAQRRTLAAVVRPRRADVSARGRRAHRCRAGFEDLRPPVGAGAVALRGAHSVRRQSFGFRAAAESHVFRACSLCRARRRALRPYGSSRAVTQAAFGQRRKMLRQSLRSLGADVPALLGSRRP